MQSLLIEYGGSWGRTFWNITEKLIFSVPHTRKIIGHLFEAKSGNVYIKAAGRQRNYGCTVVIKKSETFVTRFLFISLSLWYREIFVPNLGQGSRYYDWILFDFLLHLRVHACAVHYFKLVSLDPPNSIFTIIATLVYLISVNDRVPLHFPHSNEPN